MKKKAVKEKGKKEPKFSKKQNKQAGIVVGTMAGIIVLILALMITSHFINNFKYIGLDFKKVKEGNLIFYTTDLQVPVNGYLHPFSIYIRNDPRKLVDIPINGTIKIGTFNTTFISTNPNILDCEDSSTSAILIGLFAKEIGANPVYASTDKEFAQKNNLSQIYCGNSGKNTALVIKKGEANIINQKNDYCYEIVFKDCEIERVIERFIIGSIAHSMGNENV